MLWACEVIYFRAIYCAVYQVFEMGFQLNVLSYKAQSVVCVFKRKWQIKLTIFFFLPWYIKSRGCSSCRLLPDVLELNIHRSQTGVMIMYLWSYSLNKIAFMYSCFVWFFLSLNPQIRLWPVCILTLYLVENSLNDRSLTDRRSKTCVKTMYTYSITIKNATFKPLPK